MGSPRQFLSGPLCAFALLGACSNALDFPSLSAGRTDDAALANAQDAAAQSAEPDEPGAVRIDDEAIERTVSGEPLDGAVQPHAGEGDGEPEVTSEHDGSAHDGGGSHEGGTHGGAIDAGASS